MSDSLVAGMSGNTEGEWSFLEHLCSLDIDSPQIKQTHMTSIIATIGPACDNVEILQDMVLAGVNIFRLVMAYGDRYSYHTQMIEKIRKAISGHFSPVGIAIDIAGPEVRLGRLKPSLGREIFLKSHSIVRFTNNTDYLDNMDDSFIYVDQKKLIDFADINSIIVIEDGPLSFIVKDKVDTHRPTPTLVCEVLNEGILGNRQTCHMNGMPDMCQLTENDEKDLSFALSQKADMVFMSLVSDAGLIKSVRKFFDDKESSIKILAKIENYKGIININEILNASDGVIISRGNLGINIKPEKVFLAQKMITKRANVAGKSVTCASQMLESMTVHPRPTRAEAGDVANSVLDGIDCVMLSSETAKGNHPLLAVKTLVQICREAEGAMFNNHLQMIEMATPSQLMKDHTTAIAAVKAAISSCARAIVVVTSTGRSAALISRYRPRCVILGVTRKSSTARQLHLYRGVIPFLHAGAVSGVWEKDYNDSIKAAFEYAIKRNLLFIGSIVVLVRGWTEGSGSTDTMCVAKVPGPDDALPMSY